MVNTSKSNIEWLGFLVFCMVFLVGPINELLASYYKPNLPFFDLYTIFVAILILPLLYVKGSDIVVKYQLLAMMAFFVYIFAVTFMSPIVIDAKGQNTIEVNLFFLRKSISYFLLGALFCQCFYFERFRNWPFIVLIVIYSCLIDWSTLRLNTFDYPDSSRWGNYHYLSECLAVISLYSISNEFKDKTKNNIIFILSVVVLFALGSRSTFFIYMLVSLSLMCFSKSYLIIFLFIGLLVLVFVLGSFVSVFDAFVNDNFRMFSIFISSDEGSTVVRKELADLGMSDIVDNWFTGDLGGQVKYGGDLWGGYIHDIRSYWRQFGLIPFILYLCTLVNLNLRNLFWVIKCKNFKSLFSYSALLFFTIESLFTRAYLSTYIYFFIGFAAFTDFNERIKNDT